MLQTDMIVGPITRGFKVPTEGAGMLASIARQFSGWGEPRYLQADLG